jgi:hypothetical protein
MASLAEVDDVDGAAQYMGGYLNMQSYRVRKYIMSAGWVFPGWGYPGQSGLKGIMAFILTRSSRVYW